MDRCARRARLWNRNHPEDPIDEDGDYGPQTGARLAAAPAEGFQFAGCAGDVYDAELVGVAPLPGLVAGAAAAWIDLRNTGTTTWTPGATFLGTTGPIDRASALFDPNTWPSPSRPATVTSATPPGEVGRFAFAVRAPGVERATGLSETFGLVRPGGRGPGGASAAARGRGRRAARARRRPHVR